MNSVGFFTPVDSKGCSLAKLADYYFWFGGRVAKVVVPEQKLNGSIAARSVESETCLMCTVFKIMTMILSFGILPILALLIKSIHRASNEYHYVPPQTRPNRQPAEPPVAVPEITPMQRAINGIGAEMVLPVLRNGFEAQATPPLETLSEDERVALALARPREIPIDPCHSLLHARQLFQAEHDLTQEIERRRAQGEPVITTRIQLGKIKQEIEALRQLTLETILSTYREKYILIRRSLHEQTPYPEEPPAEIQPHDVLRYYGTLSNPPLDINQFSIVDSVALVRKLDELAVIDLNREQAAEQARFEGAQ
jgi:hypothetical protein